jgi:hypothetical protein
MVVSSLDDCGSSLPPAAVADPGFAGMTLDVGMSERDRGQATFSLENSPVKK